MLFYIWGAPLKVRGIAQLLHEALVNSDIVNSEHTWTVSNPARDIILEHDGSAQFNFHGYHEIDDDYDTESWHVAVLIRCPGGPALPTNATDGFLATFTPDDATDTLILGFAICHTLECTPTEACERLEAALTIVEKRAQPSWCAQ